MLKNDKKLKKMKDEKFKFLENFGSQNGANKTPKINFTYLKLNF